MSFVCPLSLTGCCLVCAVRSALFTVGNVSFVVCGLMCVNDVAVTRCGFLLCVVCCLLSDVAD